MALNVEQENKSFEPGNVLIGFRGSEFLDARVKKAAAHAKVSVSEFMRAVLCDYLRKYEMLYEPQQEIEMTEGEAEDEELKS